MPKNIGIIFAGGVGKRMGDNQIPKQFLIVDEKPIVIHTLEYFENHDEIDDIYIACVKSGIDHLQKLVDEYHITKVRKIVEGGVTSQDSIYNALTAARQENEGDSIVLIHDGVRPFITKSLISEVIESVKTKGTGITCTPCYETIIISEDGDKVDSIPKRKDAYSAQAPQGLILDEIIKAHEEMRKINPSYDQIVDSCTLIKSQNKEVSLVLGNKGNIKITKPEDVYILEALLEYRKSEEILGVSFLDSKNDSNEVNKME